MAIGDLYRLNIIWRRVADQSFLGENVLVYRQESAHMQSNPSLDLAHAFLAEALPDVTNVITAAVSCSLLQVRGITIPSEGDDLAFAAVIGGQSGDAYDWAMGLRQIWRTGLIGRSFQGRSTFPPASEASCSAGGQLIEAFRGNAQILLNSCITLPSSATHGEWQLGVLSRFSGGVERPTPLFTPVSTGQLATHQGILRQRRD